MLKKQGHHGYTLLIRNGDGVGKSVRHMHFHLVPDALVGKLDRVKNVDARTVLSHKKQHEIMKRLLAGMKG